MDDPRLLRLALLADLSQDRESVALRALRTRIAALRSEIAALTAGEDPVSPSAYNLAGGGSTLARWQIEERKRINLMLARLLAEEAAQSARVAKATARAGVIARLRRAPR